MKTLFELRMKQLAHLRKRLAHKAVGPLLGAFIAALLLIALMIHVNHGQGPSVHGNGDSHGFVRTEVSRTVWIDAVG